MIYNHSYTCKHYIKLTKKYFCSIKKQKRFLTPILFFLIFLSLTPKTSICQAIAPDSSILRTITDSFKKYDNNNFDRHIKSIRLTNPDWELSYPVIELGQNNQLLLSFDYLHDDNPKFTYKIYHLNCTWTGHDAFFAEYATGFELNLLDNYESSYSALESYQHYQLLFPNSDIQLNISGNYLIEVYKNDSASPVFRRRFVVYENTASVGGQVQRDMSTHYGSTSHKIPLTINLHGIQVSDPYSEIVLNVLPNNNWNRKHSNFQPLYIKGNQLVYQDKDENIFDAGNEYRTINIKDISYEAIMVEKIQKINSNYHVKLKPDFSRRYTQYEQHQDLNGHFVIEKSNSFTPNLDADYVFVYFTLKVEQPILTGQVFVYGALSDYTFNQNNVMSYNPSKKQYELRMKLKQGFYDYQYVVTDAYKNYKPDFTQIEGSHWQTQNDYLVYVYYKDFQNGYHRVIGFETLRTDF